MATEAASLDSAPQAVISGGVSSLNRRWCAGPCPCCCPCCCSFLLLLLPLLPSPSAVAAGAPRKCRGRVKRSRGMAWAACLSSS